MYIYIVEVLLIVFATASAKLTAIGADDQTYNFSALCGRSNVFPLYSNNDPSGGVLFLAADNSDMGAYQANFTCNLTLSPPESNEVFLTFTKIHLRKNDSISVLYNNGTEIATFTNETDCPDEDCPNLQFFSTKEGKNIILDFYSSPEGNVSRQIKGFSATFAVFSTGGSCNDKNYFKCDNGRCIWGKLRCNGHNNCGDLSDEKNCIDYTKNVVWGVLVIVFGVVAFVIFVPVFCFLAIYGVKSVVTTTTVPNSPSFQSPSINDDEMSSGSLENSQENSKDDAPLIPNGTDPTTWQRKNTAYGTLS